MGILEAAKPAVVICTRTATAPRHSIVTSWGSRWCKRIISRLFSASEESRCVSRLWLISCRINTILGFCVPDVPSTVRALQEAGVTFNIYRNFPQANSAS